jgi:hypothetical protein
MNTDQRVRLKKNQRMAWRFAEAMLVEEATMGSRDALAARTIVSCGSAA